MSKCFIVLGMHRSATSMIAKALYDQDHIDFRCPPQKPCKDEPFGHFEHHPIVGLNQKILRAAGGCWHRPPARKKIMAVAKQFRGQIQDVLKETHDNAELWGWKDPRMSLTCELYLPFIEKPHLIAIVREPEEVARSLQKRNKFPLQKGRNLTAVYNQRIADLIQRFAEGSVPTKTE